MNDIKEGVRAYLERESSIHAVCAPARHTGEYPLLTADAREDGAGSETMQVLHWNESN